MSQFDQKYEEWLKHNIDTEKNHRRRELLKKGLGYGTVEFLRKTWFPVVGNFDNLYPEWEVRDFNNGYRYLDLAYTPGGAKGGIEIQGYATHARDLDVTRFKDLCRRHCLLALDGWIFLPVAFPSIIDEPQQCQQLVLSFIGRFVASDLNSELTCLEAETARFARRLLRPITPLELASHLRVSDRHTRRILNKLVELQIMESASGDRRNRTFKLRF